MEKPLGTLSAEPLTRYSGPATLLIADRNPRVRNFLRREMTGCGYQVCLVTNAHELVQQLSALERVDLVLLDPDLPGMYEHPVVELLYKRMPQLPVIVHTFLSVYVDWIDKLPGAHFIEKNANSIELIKRAVEKLLR